VKWIEDRNEHLLSSGQAREAADVTGGRRLMRDGTILALRGELVVDQERLTFGVPSPVAGGHVGLVTNLMPGPYKPARLRADVKVIVSNKCTFNAYRAPWAIETWSRGADDRHDRARTRPRSGRRTAKNFAVNDGNRQDAQAARPCSTTPAPNRSSGYSKRSTTSGCGPSRRRPASRDVVSVSGTRPSSRQHPDPLPVGA